MKTTIFIFTLWALITAISSCSNNTENAENTGNKENTENKGEEESTGLKLPPDTQPLNTSFKRRVMALQFTGTGCPYCPSMIAAVHELSKSDVAGKTVFTVIHAYYSNDIMFTSTMKAIGTAYGNNSYPGFGVNFRKEIQNSSGVNILVSRLTNMIDKELEGSPAKAGISAAVQKNGNELLIKVAIKAAVTGTFKAGAWVLEDNIYARQSNGTTIKGYDFDTHNNVVREISSRNNNDFSGENLGEIAKGETKTQVFNIKINSEWQLENCRIVCFVSTPDTEDSATKFYINNAITCKIDDVKPFEYK